MSVFRFLVREVKDGACNQYSYEGEVEFCMSAGSAAGIGEELARVFGSKVIKTAPITGGVWRGGFCVTFESGRWARVAKYGNNSK